MVRSSCRAGAGVRRYILTVPDQTQSRRQKRLTFLIRYTHPPYRRKCIGDKHILVPCLRLGLGCRADVDIADSHAAGLLYWPRTGRFTDKAGIYTFAGRAFGIIRCARQTVLAICPAPVHILVPVLRFGFAAPGQHIPVQSVCCILVVVDMFRIEYPLNRSD